MGARGTAQSQYTFVRIFLKYLIKKQRLTWQGIGRISPENLLLEDNNRVCKMYSELSKCVIHDFLRNRP